MTLTVDELTVQYRRRTAVDAVSWRLDEGFHALLGPNGAGKSSLLRAIATLQPASGIVELDGRTGTAIREQLGYCPQENLGRSRFTVREHLAYLCWLHRIPDSKTPAEVDRVVELVSLTDRADDRISALSGGMRRRVGIGSALVGRPSLVILDEPSAGLDVAQRESLSAVLQRVAADAITIVSTHIVEDVLDHADTLTVMDQSRFVFSGAFDEFAGSRDLEAVRSRYLEMVTP
ncbi:ATP-binding cassette domain-containing protein [Acidipropionibacterium virtanenii]|uniref:Putative ABC transporter ATP-binding protein YxlF n=1 Tax=Acidipropionibacterium virtanenii TaxID=2057246 RepID=A0A344UQC4_9ACTN|nr:ATP-binding cassette domain-containing protein [Acidipropionibacterium virtanenii]AXE37472.1 putative ABC transporter ATP-binding protein YxlF [Acidipropionibacterium virtanenii]